MYLCYDGLEYVYYSNVWYQLLVEILCNSSTLSLSVIQDGRLRVNDLLLSVNGQSLTNMSNSNALEALKKALHNAKPEQVTSIQLVNLSVLCV